MTGKDMDSLPLGLPSPEEERTHVKTMAKPKPRTMVLPIPRGDCTKISASKVIWSNEENHRRITQGDMYEIWSGGGRRARNAGSRAHVHRATAEI